MITGGEPEGRWPTLPAGSLDEKTTRANSHQQEVAGRPVVNQSATGISTTAALAPSTD